MKRLKVIALGGVLLAVLFWLLLPSYFGHATSAAVSAKSVQSCGAWNVVSSPHPKGILPVLNGVAAITSNNVWAVGDYYKTSQSAYVSLIEHWTGTKWQVIPSPSENYITNLNGITALNANDIWAVGSTETQNTLPSTLIEHWNGTNWSIVPSPNPGRKLNQLFGVAAGPANDVWAVGDYSNNGGNFNTLIEHWNGTSWSVVPSPSTGNFDTLNSVSVVKNTDQVWAVGNFTDSSNTNEALIEHWQGSHWVRVAAPNNGSGILTGVQAISATDVWAVGTVSNQTLTEHWNGTNWSVIPSPSIGVGANVLLGVAAVSATNVWAVGYYPQDPGFATLTEQWNGTSWNIVASGDIGKNDQLNAVSAVQTTGKLWSVGYSTKNKNTTITELYC